MVYQAKLKILSFPRAVGTTGVRSQVPKSIPKGFLPQRVTSESGMVQGLWSALGARAQKRGLWKRERASATSFETPRTWQACTAKLSCMDGEKYKLSNQIDNAGHLRMPQIYDSYHQEITNCLVTPELKTLPWVKGVPYGVSDDNSREANDPETTFPENSLQILLSQEHQ